MPRVDLVTTDGFLFPNAVLAHRGLMERKGFPESYDAEALRAAGIGFEVVPGVVGAPRLAAAKVNYCATYSGRK